MVSQTNIAISTLARQTGAAQSLALQVARYFMACHKNKKK